MREHRVNRREFLLQGAAATATLAAGSRLAGAGAQGPAVVIARDRTQRAIQGQTVDATIVQTLVDRAVMALSGRSDAAQAWATYAGPRDKVAVKFNGLFPSATTHPAVLLAVTNGLTRAGVDPANIVVYDRNDEALRTAGLTLNRTGTGPRIYGTGSSHGDSVRAGTVETRLSRILLEADVLINVPMMKTHELAGISGALKNHLGTVPNASAFHADPEDRRRNNCITVADLNALDPIRTKSRLCLCDALYVLYHNGPRYNAGRFRWDYHGIVASVDPVAMDVTLADIIRAKRVEQGLSPFHQPLAHVERAVQLGLGVGDLARIRRVETEV